MRALAALLVLTGVLGAFGPARSAASAAPRPWILYASDWEGPMEIKISAQQLAERLQQAFNDSVLAMHAALYAEDAVYYEASQKVQGREAVQELLAVWYQAFSEVRLEYRKVWTCDDHFIYEGTMYGTHTGSLPTPEGDVPPTGRKIEIPFAFIAKMSTEGLIQEDRTYFDSALMTQQLGLG